VPRTGHKKTETAASGSKTKIVPVKPKLMARHQAVNHSTKCPDQDLPENDGADAELLHVIVATNPAHEGKKCVRRDKHRKPIAKDREWSGHAEEPGEQQHDDGHDQTRERAGK
jgi:hypothetical protein